MQCCLFLNSLFLIDEANKCDTKHCIDWESLCKIGGLFFKESGLDPLSRKHSRILTKKVESSLNNTFFSSCKIVLES